MQCHLTYMKETVDELTQQSHALAEEERAVALMIGTEG